MEPYGSFSNFSWVHMHNPLLLPSRTFEMLHNFLWHWVHGAWPDTACRCFRDFFVPPGSAQVELMLGFPEIPAPETNQALPAFPV